VEFGDIKLLVLTNDFKNFKKPAAAGSDRAWCRPSESWVAHIYEDAGTSVLLPGVTKRRGGPQRLCDNDDEAY